MYAPADLQQQALTCLGPAEADRISVQHISSALALACCEVLQFKMRMQHKHYVQGCTVAFHPDEIARRA